MYRLARRPREIGRVLHARARVPVAAVGRSVERRSASMFPFVPACLPDRLPARLPSWSRLSSTEDGRREEAAAPGLPRLLCPVS